MFSDQDRKIFGPIFNGREVVHIDPTRVKRKMSALCPGNLFNEHLLRWKNPQQEVDPQLSLESSEIVLDCIIKAFDLIPFDPLSGNGLSDDDVIDVWNSYSEWVKKKLTSTENSQTSALSMDCPMSGDWKNP